MLPPELAKHLDFSEARRPPIGFSGDEMWLLPRGFDGKPAVLKYSKRIEVYEEGLINEWLKDKLPVPEVYFNQRIGDIYYLVTQLVAGEMLADTFKSLTKQETLILYGCLLRRIHEVDIKQFPCLHDRAYKLAKVKGIVERNEVKTQYFERELQGQNPLDLFRYLVTHQRFSEDLVFCHGDVCFPNFIYHNSELAAVLDVSGAGINDRHLDLAIGLRTLRYNFELLSDSLTQDDIRVFLEAYGIDCLDMEKVKFYIILDELTNG